MNSNIGINKAFHDEGTSSEIPTPNMPTEKAHTRVKENGSVTSIEPGIPETENMPLVSPPSGPSSKDISDESNLKSVKKAHPKPEVKSSNSTDNNGILQGSSLGNETGYLWGLWNVWSRTQKVEKDNNDSPELEHFEDRHKEIELGPCESKPAFGSDNTYEHTNAKTIAAEVINPSLIPDKILIQSPTTGVVEQTITSTESGNLLPSSDTEAGNVDTNPDANFIWDITRRVSKIPFLPLSVSNQLNIDGLAPNKCSQVTDNDQQTVSSDTNGTTNSDSQRANTGENTKIGSWWAPWRWEFTANKDLEESASESGTGLIEDELMKVQRKEIANQIKCQSYGIPKSITWGILRQKDEDFGHVYITGKSYKKPVLMKNFPTSAFELQEQQLTPNSDNNKNNQAKVESIVLPDIEWNYRNLTLRTRCRIAMSKVPALKNMFAPQSHLYYDSHMKKNQSSKKIEKKALIISFHGFLPQKIVKNIIGESTGSSQRMEEQAAKELKRWSDINNVELNIETINLEGYGKLFERVNECLSILENWIENISSCDFILAVANSHSVPLAIHVIARLITSGYLDKTEKLGFIGLSGICMGPIPEVESKISIRGNVGQDADIISEILDLEDPDSLQSKELSRNMKVVIRKNFKVTFVGSLNDCFSPIYSSLGLHLLHPNIYRALYIDGSQHQPDFLTSLFNLILTVKNLNYSDHGLLIELSNFFTGQIGDGQHSKVLTNKYAFRIGISNMLNTSDLFYQQKVVEELTNIREYTTNSYHIPWCLRGFLEELEKLQKHFDAKQIIEQLYEEFKSWEPETQKMKDLRYCMLAFESVMNEDLGL